MTINFNDLFAKLGLFFNAGNQANTSGASIKAEIEDAVQGIDASDPIEQYEAVEPATAAVGTMLEGLAAANAAAVQSPVQQLLLEIVDADNPLPSRTPRTALDELIRQMLANSETVEPAAVSATPSYAGGNNGDGAFILSVLRNDGKTNAHCLAEDIEFLFDGISFQYAGEEAQFNKLHPEWPKGSGIAATINSVTASGGGNLLAGAFETEDENEADLPEGWIATPATFGTTLKLTNVEEQTVTISGTPTSGYYILSFTNRDADVQSTVPLAYNASGATVEQALRDLIGLDAITVDTSGSEPNFTHTITFIGVPNPGQLTNTDTFDTGSVGHATTVAGADVGQGARALELDSNGSEQTAIYYPITLEAGQQYAFSTLIRADVVPAAGVLTVDLIDGVGGTVLTDDEGASNSFTIDATALSTSWENRTGVFRAPSVLPATAYLRFRISTAVSSGTSIFVDEMLLVAMTRLYAGGPALVVATGRTAWGTGDRVTVAVANDRGGSISEWMNRCFDMRDSDLLLPDSGNTGATLPDATYIV